MLLNKNNFKDIIKRKTKIVKCDDFEVKIQALLIEDQLKIEKLNNDEKNDNNQFVFLMLKLSCIDDNGDPVLDDELVKQLPSNLALKLFEECLKLNGLNGKELEERAKNS